jgi:hypothetical protein
VEREADVPDVLGIVASETEWTELGRLGTVTKRRPFLDFTVNGQPFRSLVGLAEYGAEAVSETTRLMDDWPDGALAQLDALLGGQSDEFGDGRVALLVCHLCGDVGCGAISAEVVLDSGLVEWRDLGWQNNYEPFNGSPVRPRSFRFVQRQYEAVLRPMRDHFAVLATGGAVPL